MSRNKIAIGKQNELIDNIPSLHILYIIREELDKSILNIKWTTPKCKKYAVTSLWWIDVMQAGHESWELVVKLSSITQEQ